jgi:hypothetical protein
MRIKKKTRDSGQCLLFQKPKTMAEKRNANDITLVNLVEEPTKRQQITHALYPESWSFICKGGEQVRLTTINELLRQLAREQRPRLVSMCKITLANEKLTLHILGYSATRADGIMLTLLHQVRSWTWAELTGIMALIDDPGKRSAQLDKITKQLRDEILLWQQINAASVPFWAALRALNNGQSIAQLGVRDSKITLHLRNQVPSTPLAQFVGGSKLTMQQLQSIDFATYRDWMANATNLLQSLLPYFYVRLPDLPTTAALPSTDSQPTMRAGPLVVTLPNKVLAERPNPNQ